jgi:hypothetical protein
MKFRHAATALALCLASGFAFAADTTPAANAAAPATAATTAAAPAAKPETKPAAKPVKVAKVSKHKAATCKADQTLVEGKCVAKKVG